MIVCIFILQCLIGFLLFAKVSLKRGEGAKNPDWKPSVIIPARNEEKNLPHILESLQNQTVAPYEIIVVDDFSSDRTSEIAGQYGGRVIHNTELPENWTGKTWAVWNGFRASTGNVLVFLDADVRLAPHALESLLQAREQCGGAVSVVPFHETERFYEKLSLVPYILGIFAFTSPFERKSSRKGLYGSCIAASREDYEKINGHNSIRSELLDDLNLGRKFSEAGIPVENFIGGDLVSFRMYPNGVQSEMQGFGKGADLSTETLRPATIFRIAVWLVGLFATGLFTPFLLVLRHPWAIPFLAGYLVYALQIVYFLRYTGSYGKFMPLLHVVSSLFFLLILLYSAYQVAFIGSVSWKGRQVRVGNRKIL